MQAEFIQGFAAAVASLARDHDRGVIAASIIVGHGLRFRDFVEAGVDDFDLGTIRLLFKTEPQLR